MPDEDAATETITVFYTDGTSQTFSGCSGYTNAGGIISFTGQLNGETATVKWEINWASVTRVRRETT